MRLPRGTKYLLSLSILAASASACVYEGTSAGSVPAGEGTKRHAGRATGVKLLPTDEGAQDASFREFREQLLTALRSRDAAFVLSTLSPNILNSLGGSGGVGEFRERWQPERRDSELWPTLISVLEMGGSFETAKGEKIFCAPYVSSRWRTVIPKLPSSPEYPEYQAVIGEKVEVRTEPNHTAPVVTTLSYDIVKVDIEDAPDEGNPVGPPEWLKVTTLEDRTGYVLGKYVRSPSDYHACFQKKDEKWLMTIFASGD